MVIALFVTEFVFEIVIIVIMDFEAEAYSRGKFP